MAALTVQTTAKTGTAITFASASAGGDTLANDNFEKTFLIVKNGSGSSINVTINVVPTSVETIQYGSLSVSDTVVAVAAGATTIIGPFKKSLYNSTSNTVSVSYSATTTVTVAAVLLGAP